MAFKYFPKTTINGISFLDHDLINIPDKMLARFVDYFELTDCKDYLWDMIKGFFVSFYAENLNNIERSNYFAFYEQLLALIEAVFLLQEKKLNRKVQ